MKNSLKVVGFCCVLALAIGALDLLFQPLWFDWNGYQALCGFYSQQPQTVEAVVVGSSLAGRAVSPIRMYEHSGVCAYNLSSPQQPTMMSYYWAREAYRLHGSKLKVVMLDVSSIRKDATPSDEIYHTALDYMQMSPVKLEAICDLSSSLDEFVAYAMPLCSYHSRWSELEATDYIKNRTAPLEYNRGYNFSTDLLGWEKGQEFGDPLGAIGNSEDYAGLNRESLYYFGKLSDFCKEKGLKLVLFKTPTVYEWAEGEHNAMQKIADDQQVPFIDFNLSPLVDDICFDAITDTSDSNHVNYYAAMRLSDWVADYLVYDCDCEDVRGSEAYGFMDQQTTSWHAKYDPLVASSEDPDPAGYLEDLMQSGNYTVFVCVRDEASESLGYSQRQKFKALGLRLLANIGTRNPYVAVISDGKVVLEEKSAVTDPLGPSNLTVDYLTSRQTLEGAHTTDDIASGMLTYTYVLPDGRSCELVSANLDAGNVASCIIDGTDWSPNQRGLNYVVYDNDTHEVVQKAIFDTYESPVRRVHRSIPTSIPTSSKGYGE